MFSVIWSIVQLTGLVSGNSTPVSICMESTKEAKTLIRALIGS